MKIMLDKKYYLTSDARNYIIGYYSLDEQGNRKMTNPKDGSEPKEITDVYGYYQDIDLMFGSFTNLKIRLSDATSWKEVKALLVDLKRLYSEIRNEIYMENK